MTAGAIAILAGIIILAGWPLNNLWLVGMLLAVDLTFHGAALVIFGLGGRELTIGLGGRVPRTQIVVIGAAGGVGETALPLAHNVSHFDASQVAAAAGEALKPSIGRTLRLIRRWSCSTLANADRQR